MAEDLGKADNSGKFAWHPIVSPKQTEEPHAGRPEATSKTLPEGAIQPDRSGKGLGEGKK